jgi:hypothetical protein
MPLGHCFLNLFFKNPGGDPVSGKPAGNDMVIRFAAYLLV